MGCYFLYLDERMNIKSFCLTTKEKRGEAFDKSQLHCPVIKGWIGAVDTSLQSLQVRSWWHSEYHLLKFMLRLFYLDLSESGKCLRKFFLGMFDILNSLC